MAGSKRRKPDGVLGFIADAVSDQQKARAQTQQLEEKAHLAWAKENAKMATANARDKARQAQRVAREREIAEGHAEAEAVTRTLKGHLTELQTLLTKHPRRRSVPAVEPIQDARADRRVQAPEAARRRTARATGVRFPARALGRPWCAGTGPATSPPSGPQGVGKVVTASNA